MPHRPVAVRRSAILLLLTTSLSPLFAHDLWLEPAADPKDPGRIELRAVVGARFPKGDETKAAADYRQTRVRRGEAVEELSPPGGDPKLLGRVEGRLAFFAATVGPTREIDLQPQEVKGYLSGEVGLDSATVGAVLQGAGTSLHETYSRYLKALVVPEGAGSIPTDVPLGLPLELVLKRWERGPDGKTRFGVVVLRDGRPLPGASLRVVTRDPGHRMLKTGDQGEASGSFSSTGPVLFAFIELADHQPGRYSTRWSNLAVFDRR